MASEPAKELRTKDGRHIGFLKGNVFRKVVYGSKHTFNKLNAWGIDYDALFKELPDKCQIRILDRETDTLYITTATFWREQGEVMRFNRGREDWAQSFLPKEKFDKIERMRDV